MKHREQNVIALTTSAGVDTEFPAADVIVAVVQHMHRVSGYPSGAPLRDGELIAWDLKAVDTETHFIASVSLVISTPSRTDEIVSEVANIARRSRVIFG